MRITLISDPRLVNTNYRAYQPMHILSARGHEIARNLTNETRATQPALSNSDVVLIHRYVDGDVIHVARQLRAAGIGIVWDNDDDILSIPRENPLYKQYSGRSGREQLTGLKLMMQLADVVTTPSRALADRFRELGASDVRVLENFVRNDFVRDGGRSHDGVVVGWLASLEHQLDYQQLGLQATFARLLDELPDLRIASIGFRLGLHHPRYLSTPGVEFTDLPDHLVAFDVGIAPIADNPFNRSRSNIKLKEYAASGVPWLASPIGPYVGMSEQQGGRLVPDDGWADAISRLVTNARDRRKLAKRAAKWGKTQTIGKNAHLWEEALSDAIGRARARTPGREHPAFASR